MRNLKRALSLALASVMLLGMMVVGAGAVSYPDVDSKDNVEAIEVLKAVGAMVGDDNGNFNPDKNVNRNEMAAVLARLLLGADAEKYVGTCPFTDVPQWAQKYVAACYDNGIVKGRSETAYDGGATVTAQEAAAMVLRVLGYQKLEGTGANWAQPVVAKANEIRLFKGLSASATAPLNRNSVAQLSLNALKANVVTTDAEGDIVVEGIVTIPGKVEYKKVDAPAGIDYNNAAAGSNDLLYIQLCEKLYDNKLKLDTSASVTDDMQRPAGEWKYKNKSIITVANDADSTYVVKAGNDVTSVDNYVKNTLKKTSWTYASNPVHVNGAGGAATATATALKVGSTVEFYMNDTTTNQVDKVIVTEPTVYTLTADAATKDVDGKTQVRVPGVAGLGGFTSSITTDDVIGWQDLKKDDVVLMYREGSGKYVITLADSVYGAVSRKGSDGKITVNGDKYAQSGLTGTSYAASSFADYDNEYTFYLDAAGAIVKAVKETDKTSSDFAYVLTSSWVTGGGDLNVSNKAQAKLLFPDGSTQIVVVSKIDGKATVGSGPTATQVLYSGANSKFVSYKVSDNEYELTTENTTALTGATIDGSSPKFDANTLVGDSATVFLVHTKDGSKDVFTAYTGIGSVPKITGLTPAKCFAKVKSGVSQLVYVDAFTGGARVEGKAGEYVYLLGSGSDHSGALVSQYVPKNGDVPAHYVYEGFVNGEYSDNIMVSVSTVGNIVDNTGDDGAADAVAAKDTLYKVVSKDRNGIISVLGGAGSSTSYPELAAKQGVKVSGGVLTTTGSAYTVDDDTVFWYITKDGTCTELRQNSVAEDSSDDIYVVKTSSSGKKADVVYIREVNNITTFTAKISVDGGADTALTFASNAAISGNLSASVGKTYKITISATTGATVNVTSGALEGNLTASDMTITFTVTAQDGTTTGATQTITLDTTA